MTLHSITRSQCERSALPILTTIFVGRSVKKTLNADLDAVPLMLINTLIIVYLLILG
jgi:hypothetical protein